MESGANPGQSVNEEKLSDTTLWPAIPGASH
jgi:hypothetical protein